MRYAQIKSGNKLHLVYELPTGGVTDPICGIKTDKYRIIINVPLGHSCKNCRRRLNAKSYDESKFLRKYI